MIDTSALPALHILHLEDSLLDHQLAERALRKAGLSCVLTRVDSLAEFDRLLRPAAGRTGFAAILADYNLPGFTALDAWAALQGLADRPPFILLSGAIGERAAVEAIKLGVSDYLAKDDMAKLGPVIQRAIAAHQTQVAKMRADAELAASEKRLAGFAEHLQSAIEQERTGIAREIHDDIGGALASIGFDLGWIARNSTDAATQEHARQASSMLHQAMAASQAIMMNLRPAILDQGLLAALEWLCASFEKRSGIKTRLVHPAPAMAAAMALDREIELVAYRTAQEALTNIAKHAACSQVQVEVSDAGGVLTLEIADNGCGIAADARAKPKSFGLIGLSERARTVGGWLDVSSCAGVPGAPGAPGVGTSITLSVPLRIGVQSSALEGTGVQSSAVGGTGVQSSALGETEATFQ